jgi:hypothetical protein
MGSAAGAESGTTAVAEATAVIDGVVNRLDAVLAWARGAPSRIGYFAAIYRRVTMTIRDDVKAGDFPRPKLIAHFDDVFAARFFHALQTFRAGGTPTAPWAIAFGASTRDDLSVVQHLLLGINAHIRLDLGVSAALVAPGSALHELRPDFESINQILDGLVPRDQREIDRVSPRVRELDPMPKLADRALDGWIHEVRARAWDVASRLAPLEGKDRTAALHDVESEAATHAWRLVDPDPVIRELLDHLVAPEEDKDIPAVIDALR